MLFVLDSVRTMHNTSKPSGSYTYVNLFFSTGILLVVGALPFGIALALYGYFKIHIDQLWVIVVAIAATITFVLLGCLSYCIGNLIVKRRQKSKGKSSHANTT
jgi:membrane protein DedA with SNARE-associated domain